MPTPFTHLAVAQRLLSDESILQPHRALLHAERGAFLLGNIAADARVEAGAPRERTHFYVYGQDIVESPWRVMLTRYPVLWQPQSFAQRAFTAGYVAHLAMDELWSKEMVAPHFVAREWGSRGFRFLMLHIILIYMDERDYRLLDPWQAVSLRSAHPADWTPFLSDKDLEAWKLLIYEQIKEGGISRTLQIFGERITKTPDEFRAILDSDLEMQMNLWSHVPQRILSETETAMYAYARESLVEYLSTSLT